MIDTVHTVSKRTIAKAERWRREQNMEAAIRALLGCPEIADDESVSIYTARVRKMARALLTDEDVAK